MILNANNMDVMQVKMNYTFSTAGPCAWILITALGLTERELPHLKCISVSIEGLCVEGGGITVGNKQKGLLLFMRGKNGADKERCKVYCDNVFLPFIRWSRTEHNEWKEGDLITSDIWAISWYDGDLEKIHNIVNEESLKLYEKNWLQQTNKIHNVPAQNKE